MDWVQWLALVGGVSAAAAFVAGRRDVARTEAAGVYVDVPGYQAAPPPPGKHVSTRYRIVNDGRLPLLSVEVSAWSWGRRRFWWRLRRHQKWMTGKRIDRDFFPSIRPNSSTPENDLAGPRNPGPPERPPLMLVFRDGFGRRWVRWPDGKLMRFAPSWCQIERVLRRAHLPGSPLLARRGVAQRSRAAP